MHRGGGGGKAGICHCKEDRRRLIQLPLKFSRVYLRDRRKRRRGDSRYPQGKQEMVDQNTRLR